MFCCPYFAKLESFVSEGKTQNAGLTQQVIQYPWSKWIGDISDHDPSSEGSQLIDVWMLEIQKHAWMDGWLYFCSWQYKWGNELQMGASGIMENVLSDGVGAAQLSGSCKEASCLMDHMDWQSVTGKVLTYHKQPGYSQDCLCIWAFMAPSGGNIQESIFRQCLSFRYMLLL